MKKRIFIVAALAALVLSGTAFAIVRHKRLERLNRPFADRLVGHLTRELSLTDAQQTQVKAILEAERSKAGPLMAEAAKNRQTLHDATANGKFDEAQVRTLAGQQAQTLTGLIVEKERVKARIYNEVLTTDQRTKADQLLQRIHNHFHARMREEASVPVVP
jgi:Spy/CpxP family protein refolding chaperone